MNKTLKSVVAMLVIIAMVLPLMPFEVFAINDREDYVEIELWDATGVDEETSTVTYENGIMVVFDENAVFDNDNGHYMLYTKQPSLDLAFEGNEGYVPKGVDINGDGWIGLMNDTFTLTDLEIGSHVNFTVQFERTQNNPNNPNDPNEPNNPMPNQYEGYAEIHINGANRINDETKTFECNDGTVAVVGEDIVLTENRFYDEQEQRDIVSHFIYTKDESLTFIFTPNEDFSAEMWMDGQQINLNENTYSLNNITEETRTTVDFKFNEIKKFEIQFDGVKRYTESSVVFDVDGKEVTLTTNLNSKALKVLYDSFYDEHEDRVIQSWRIRFNYDDLYKIKFSLAGYDADTMQVSIIGDQEYNSILAVADNSASLNGLNIPGEGIHLGVASKNAPGPGGNINIPAPELEAGYLTASMFTEERASGVVKYYFVDEDGFYLKADGTPINNQKQPAGEIKSSDEIQKVAIPENTKKVLLGIEEGAYTQSLGDVTVYYNEDEGLINKDDMKYGRTIELEYTKGDAVGISIGWFFWVPDGEYYPEEAGTYLRIHFMGNNDTIIKGLDENNQEQSIGVEADGQVFEVPKKLSIKIPSDKLGHVGVTVYDENLNYIDDQTPAGNINELLRYGNGENDTYFDNFMQALFRDEMATLDLTKINKNYTYVIDINLIDPTSAYQAHVLTWTNMLGSGWGDDALIDGGFARCVKAYDAKGNLIWDITKEYPEANYLVDDKGNRTTKYIYGEEMEYIWERGPMYPFAIDQAADGGEIEAVAGTKLVMEFTPAYGKQLVNVSLGEQEGNAEEGNAKYYVLTMPANHVHFNAQFKDVNNEGVVAENSSVSKMVYVLDDNALDSGTAVLSIDKVEDLTDKQKQDFGAEAGDGYEVTTYLDVDLTQVWFKGVDAAFDEELGYSDEEVWKNEIYDLGDKKATITITLDEGISPDDIVILHELHEGDRVVGYEKVTIIEKKKNSKGIWTVTFQTSKFSNYAIAEKTETLVASYKVEFNTNGGTKIANQTVDEGSKAAKPSDPTKEGYKFGGWYKDAELNSEFDFDDGITKDTTVYAKWIEVKVESADETTVTEKATQEVAKLINDIAEGKAVEGISNELAQKINDAIVAEKEIEIELSLTKVDENTVKEDAEKVKEKISEDAKVAEYYDIDVNVIIDGVLAGTITKLGDKVTISLNKPENLPEVKNGYKRVFKVVKVHNGLAVEVATKDNGKTCSFDADEFSTYALTYTDEKIESTETSSQTTTEAASTTETATKTNTTTTTKSSSPKTGDSVVQYVAMLMIGLLGVVSTKKFKNKIRTSKH